MVREARRIDRLRWPRVVLVLGAALALVALALFSAVHRSATDPTPEFVIMDVIEIQAPPEFVWQALTGVDALDEWNPYLLALEGELTEGEGIVITILQRNWDEPMVLPVTLATVEADRALGWRGTVLTPGVHDTHHFFTLMDLGGGRTRFEHVEEFAGVLARWIHTDATREHTRVAFAEMNAALARRSEALAAAARVDLRE